MTTASIGKGVTVAGRACVALLSRQGGASLGAIASRAGHEVFECAEWADLVALVGQQQIDLVLMDEEHLGSRPASLAIPALLLGERQGPVPGCIASLSAEQFAGNAEPLLAMASALGASRARCHELERLVQGIHSGTTLIGNTPVARRLQSAISRAADADATVLIEGPVGSGKSLAARMIHCKSRRGAQAIAVVDAAAVDAEGFGKLLQRHANTTLVIEGVDALPAAAQAVLVRNLKERTSIRAQSWPRVIATTAAHLPELVARGAFREDLYYRLHAMPILVPALRERVEDIVPIAESVLSAVAQPSGRPAVNLSASARILLESMPWPGNVTQLEAVLHRAQILAGGGPIEREHLLSPGPTTPAAASNGNSTAATVELELGEQSIRPFEEEEQELLSRALRATKGNVRRAAQLLGIGRATLYRKIQQYHLRMQ